MFGVSKPPSPEGSPASSTSRAGKKLGRTKRRILRYVRAGMTQHQIVKKLGINKSAVSRHMKDLEYANFIRPVVRSTIKIWETHPEYFKFVKKKVNLFSIDGDKVNTQKRTEKSQLMGKKSTPESLQDIESLSTSPIGLGERKKRSTLHHLFIPIPFIGPGKTKQTWSQTNDLNNVREHYKTLDDRITIRLYENKGTGLISSSMITVKLTDFDPALDPKPQIRTIFNEVVETGCSYLTSLGFEPDRENICVADIHISRLDEISVEDGKVLNKQRFCLPRMREKLTVNDPDQQAYFEWDRTPGPAENEETNDMEHDRRRAMLAENIYSLLELTERSVEAQANQTKILDKYAAEIATHLGTYKDMRSAIQDFREALRSFKEALFDVRGSAASPQGETSSTGLSGPPAGVILAKLEKLDPWERVKVRILANIRDFVVHGDHGNARKIDHLKAGSEIYLTRDQAIDMIKWGEAETIG